MRKYQLFGLIILCISATYLAIAVAPKEHKAGNYIIKATVTVSYDNTITKISVCVKTKLGDNDGMLIQNSSNEGGGFVLQIMALDSYARKPGNMFWAYVRLLIDGKPVDISPDNINGQLISEDKSVEWMDSIKEGDRIKLAKTIRVNVDLAFYIFLIVIILWSAVALNPLIIALLIPVLAILIVNIPPYDVFSVFWDPAIALVFGAFVIAYSMDKSGLAKRLSYSAVSKAKSPRKLMFYLAFISYVLSMWMSSLATMLLMLPIISTILKAFNASEKSRYAQGITLAVIFASILGGMSTLVGNPANALAASIVYRSSEIRIEFVDWMIYSVPVSVFVLFVIIYILSRFFDAEKDVKDGYIKFDQASFLAFEAHLMGMGPLTREEKITISVLTIVIVSWLVSSILSKIGLTYYYNVAAISMCGALILLATNVFSVDDLKNLRWDILLILGGSLSLAVLMKNSGLLDVFISELHGLSPMKITMLILPIITILSGILGSMVSIAIILPLVVSTMNVNIGFVIYLSLVSTAIIFGPNGVVLEEHARGRGFLKYESFVKTSILYMAITLGILIPIIFMIVT